MRFVVIPLDQPFDHFCKWCVMTDNYRPIRLTCGRCHQPFVWTAEAQAVRAARGARMNAPKSCFPCRDKRQEATGRQGVARYTPRG